MRHVILAILLIGLPAASIAAPAPAETPQFKKCMAAGDTTANKTHQWAACWDDELGCQDAILNVTYKKVQASATPEVRDLLVEGQRVWRLSRSVVPLRDKFAHATGALVKEGRAAAVRDYLDHIALGGFAGGLPGRATGRTIRVGL